MKIRPGYVIIPLITILVALIGSWFTSNGMDWYENTVIKPELNPPKWIFPIVWNTIFFLVIFSATRVYQLKDEYGKNRAAWIFCLFGMNAFFNVFWSFIFFNQHLILGALIEMILLELTNLGLIILIWKKSKAAAIALFPYLIWVAFATLLTIRIWQLNT